MRIARQTSGGVGTGLGNVISWATKEDRDLNKYCPGCNQKIAVGESSKIIEGKLYHVHCNPDGPRQASAKPAHTRRRFLRNP